MADVTTIRPRRGPLHLPGPAFLGVVAGACGALWAAQAGLVPMRAGLFTFMLAGWLASLCLHEYGHALAAHRLGDDSVAGKGYLTLDPLRYADPMTSIIVPGVFLLLGGFALPGGCVYVDLSRIRGRLARSAVSAAGPLANLAVLVAVAAAFALGVGSDGPDPLSAGLALLAYLQAIALFLNLLPVPGLDGWGILRPWLPPSVRDRADALSGPAWIGLVAVLWLAPGAARAVWQWPAAAIDALGVPGELGRAAFAASLFWL